MSRASIFISLALVLAVPAFAQEGKAEKDFKAALDLQNEREIEKAARQLVVQGDPGSAKLLLNSLANPKNEVDVYWIIIRACSAFSNTNALEAVTDYVITNKSKPVARDLTMALHNNFTPGCEAVMIKILKEGTEELRLLALDHLADIGGKDTAQAVVDVMKKEGDKGGSSEVRRRMCIVMKSITKENYGDSVSNWIGWWDANSSKDWKELKKSSTSEGAGSLGSTRAEELDQTREQKVLILHAGSKCACKKNHDLDPNIDKVLNDTGIKFDKITKDEMDKPNGKIDSGEVLDLKKYIAIIAICTHIREHCKCPTCKPGGAQSMRLFQCTGCDKHENTRFVLNKPGIDKIKKYVDAGGYLFSEDWILEEVLQIAWPQFVKCGAYLKEQDVAVLPKVGSGTHPYLRKIFVKPPSKKNGGGTSVEEDVAKIEHEWHIDQDSPAITIVDKNKVQTLLFSETVGIQADKNGSDAVAITFMPGMSGSPDVASGQNRETLKGGRVVHVLSHFGKQGQKDAGQKGEATLMNLMINFLNEAAQRRALKK